MSETATLRVAGLVNDSIVDGPGFRFTVFVQGCPHHCPGCHNPQSHDPNGGEVVTLEEIKARIAKNPMLSGVTFSGGEPFEQSAALAELGRWVREQGLELAVYTGYTFEQLLDRPGARELLDVTDTLIDGRFELSQKSLLLRFKGSRNQRVLDVPGSLAAGQAVLDTSDRWE